MMNDPTRMVIVLMAAILLDLIYGEHKGLLLKIHPTVVCSSIARYVIRPYGSKLHGVATLLIPLLLTVTIYTLIQHVSLYVLGGIGYLLISAFILKMTFSIRMLYDIVSKACKCMEEGDWILARSYVQNIVRRDVSKLDEDHVVSAAIESLFESLVDGYTSPLLYYLIFGVPGALVQRVVNTMDSVVGYKTLEYRDEGYVSAKADTILNYVPARITAFLIIFSAMILGYNWRRGLKILLRDHSKTESVNAGWPMSAIAGVLGVRLEKINHYRLGDPLEKLTSIKVKEALTIFKLTTMIYTAGIITILIIANHYIRLLLQSGGIIFI